MSQAPLSEAERQRRKERFRYVDLTHPLMQVLFDLQLPEKTSGAAE